MAGCSRKNRKDSRKNRKNSRKNRKNSRKNSRKMNSRRNRRNMRRTNAMYGGGEAEAAPMGLPSTQNLAQGREFQETHRNQHGGGSWSGAGLGAPVGYTGTLPQELVASARVGPTLQALQAASGMSDTESAPAAPAQTGGGRRRKSSRKSRKSRKGRKGSRRQRGGAYSPAEYNSPTMLLSPAQAAKAGTADFSNPLLKY